MKKIYTELSRIQQELKAPKNLYNSFGKYKYRNAEGILEAVKPLLNGMALIINDDVVCLGSRFYVKATVTLTDGEDSVSAVAYAREDETKKGMDGCQITGACSSYARKYALNALLMIDDSKDSDDDSLSPKNPDNQEKMENLPMPEGGNVIKQGKLPVDAQVNTVANFIRNEISDIQEQIGAKTYKDARDRVFLWADELVASKAINPVDWLNITMDEAQLIFRAIRSTFRPGDAA